MLTGEDRRARLGAAALGFECLSSLDQICHLGRPGDRRRPRRGVTPELAEVHAVARERDDAGAIEYDRSLLRARCKIN